MADNFQKKPLNEEESLDELIRSTQEEIRRCDEMMGEKKPETQTRQEPAFQPELPREYAELTVEKETPGENASAGRISTGKKTFIYVASVLLTSMLLAFFAWRCLDDVAAFTRREQIITVTVEEGDSVSDVARTLKKAGLIRNKWLFKLYCAFSNAENKIVPGTYDLNAVFDYHALVNGMASSGLRATVSVMIPEGYECKEIFALLEEKGVCSAEALWDAAANEEFDYAFLQGAELGNPNRLEGCLFPDTYEFYVDDEPRNVLSKFLRNLDGKLTQELWQELDVLNANLRVRKANAGFSQTEIAESELSMYDVLNVASLIEREAANGTEAGTIASVIYNRLCSKAYPCLNIDATIQYALPERKEVLSDSDKLIDSPYNTYKYAGLPAGAISNPGMTSIRGALYPQDTNYYFYALGNNGMHTFTRNYDEHLAFLEGLKNG